MKIGKKADTPEEHPHVIPVFNKTPKRYTVVEITSTHNYNTRSSTKIVKYVKTFKNPPKMFQVKATEKIKTHIGTE